MIELQNISKSFELSKKERKSRNTQQKQINAVSDISFTCEPGRIHALLGPNGAGKTTTLRMLAGLITPSRGQILINKNQTHKTLETRQHIGFLTGNTGLYDRLTPDELLAYFAKLYKVESSDFESRKNRLYKLLDMEGFKHKRIGKLSSGMTQKVSIARTMIHDPSIVIFDEPTNALDVISAENIINLISDCKEQGKTVIFSSHIMSEVDLLADDLSIIDQGKMLYSGTYEDFKNEYKDQGLTKAFIEIINNNRQV